VKSHWAEHVTQKARKEAEAKVRKEAKKRRVVKEEKKKKRTLEYIQQLQNEMLEKDTTILEGTEEFQIIGSKYKEVFPGNDTGY